MDVGLGNLMEWEGENDFLLREWHLLNATENRAKTLPKERCRSYLDMHSCLYMGAGNTLQGLASSYLRCLSQE